MVLIHVSKDPLDKTPVSGNIHIFSQVLNLRWKQDRRLFKLNGKPSKHRNLVLNNLIKFIISIKCG